MSPSPSQQDAQIAKHLSIKPNNNKNFGTFLGIIEHVILHLSCMAMSANSFEIPLNAVTHSCWYLLRGISLHCIYQILDATHQKPVVHYVSIFINQFTIRYIVVVKRDYKGKVCLSMQRIKEGKPTISIHMGGIAAGAKFLLHLCWF